MALDVPGSEHQILAGLSMRLFHSVPLGRLLIMSGILGVEMAWFDSKLPLIVKIGPFALVGECIIIWFASRED